MGGKLEAFLECISCQKTIHQTYGRANEAINTFEFDKAIIHNWDQFRLCVAEFMRHLDACMLNMDRPADIPAVDYWPMCVRPLLKIYGINGEKAAFEMTRTGNQGGLYAVLKALAMHMAELYTRNEISAKVRLFLGSLTVDEYVDTTTEYIRKYGHIIPPEMTEQSAARIKVNFEKVLIEHPFVIQKLQQAGRKYG